MKILRFLFLVFLLVLAFIACAPEIETAVSPTPLQATKIPTATAVAPTPIIATPLPLITATPTVESAVPIDLNEFVIQLTEAGLEIALGETFPARIFSVPIQTLQVNGSSVLVYEYSAVETAVIEASWIKSDGTEFLYPDPDNPEQMIATIVEPAGTPHFFRLENLLVNYNGDDLTILTALQRVLGSQFVGGPIPTATATAVPSPLPPTSPTADTLLIQKQAIDSLNPTAQIKIPFVREGRIYLYQDGQEKLVAEPAGTTSNKACFNLINPFLSPDGTHLAYIDQAGEPYDEFWGCLGGFLRIVDLATGIDTPTSYKIRSFRWTSTNLVQFRLDREIDERDAQFIEKEIFLDPVSWEEHVFVTLYSFDPETFAETRQTAEYPSDQLTHLIRFQEDAYFLVSILQNEATFLFNKDEVFSFIGWSPNGRFALFETQVPAANIFGVMEWVVDVQNPGGAPVEIAVGRGAAGGDIPAGRKWYFEEGFVPYCREELYFIDGRSPLQLTNDGGGGCNNEEGYVATSPSGDFALLKFQDRFELHDQQGNITVVQEVEPIFKSRGTPKNFIWLNDNFMVIYQSSFAFRDNDKPRIYLFDRQDVTIKLLIENAYLADASP